MKSFAKSIIFLLTVFCLNLFSVYAQNFKCGDKIRISHVATGANLHSHNINYTHSNTSGQQQITAYQGADDNDIWILEDCTTNQLRHGSEFRLQHLITKKYLHSHANFPAPITQSQQEITGWEGKDSNDYWRVEVEGRSNWSVGKKIRLIHSATNVALHSHPVTGGALPAGQQEVTGYSGRDNNDLWTVDYATETSGGSGGSGGDLTFNGFIQRSDILSKLSISNNGRVDYNISIRNRDRFIGSCIVSYLIFSDSRDNIVKAVGGEQLCVEGSMPARDRANREDKLRYTLSRDETSRVGKVTVLFTPGGKISLDLFRGNLNRLNEMLQSCPECVRKDVSVNRRQFFN